MKKIVIILVIVFATNSIFTSCNSDKKEVKKEQVSSDKKEIAEKDVYQCPMKCEDKKTYDKEGNCPVCKMKLRKKEAKKQNNH